VSDFVPHHLSIASEHTTGNRGAGRLFLLPGSDGRARRIAERFAKREVIPSDRQLNVHLGQLASDDLVVDVGAVATGMGCPSLDIVVTELIRLGARLFLRVGTAGSLQPGVVRVGDLVIATGAVRDEATSDAYAPREFPAVADPDLVRSLERAAERCGLGEHTFRGLVHSKDSLFGREFHVGPRAAANQEYMRQLAEMGALASEMETAHLLVLAGVHRGDALPLSRARALAGAIRCGAVLAIIGDDRPFAEPELVARAEEGAIDVALAGTLELFRWLFSGA